ncbi:hypothetical protein Har1130_03745 [Haloarcula sp. CBA1130]|uniref:hypothetical protein n=1 Tax=unclassified Haloarcula TaxID=2624677 RepID=UPI001244C7CF|nr:MULTISPECIES: hypothetical protein [unclassified Haloarcula]KAA9398508.1 hypothetical protein Har1129_09910 [Haloarcula sp. CBA1129]KAA9401900.1 hypothetical protein Har1130_03745 [Haloarcula sp. CBA1130]
MKVTSVEERDFRDLDSDEQVEYIKNGIREFAARVVILVGMVAGAIWYTTTQPDPLKTYEIIIIAHLTIFPSLWIGYYVYKQESHVLDAIRAIQNGGDAE